VICVTGFQRGDMPFPGEDTAHSVIGLLEECEDRIARLEAAKGSDPKVVEYLRKTRESVADMMKWVRENNRATDAQEEYAFRMRDGLDRWLIGVN
jgi:hypothetical protein